MDGINIIKLPQDTLADINHKWGKGPQHFVQEAYEYLGNEIDRVISSNTIC